MKFEGMERRRFIRLEDVDLPYSILKRLSGKLLFVKNVCSGGVSIFSREELSLGTLLVLRIILPNSKEPIQIEGKVVWCSETPDINLDSGKQYDIGIEFIHVTMDDQLLIKSYVTNLKKSRSQDQL